MNALGLCQCGCSQATTIANQTDPRIGAIKGQPYRFIRGHARRCQQARVDGSGYILVVQPDNPRASSRRVHEHVAVVERVLGHPLPAGAVVHHVDSDRTNNRNDNLAALQSHAEHVALHTRLRVLRAGGNPWTQRLCCDCHAPKDFDQFYKPKDRAIASRCKACSRARAIEQQRVKREAA